MMTFKISELANEFQVTPRSIRFYEDMGLLSPKRDGVNRIYGRRDKTRLALILRGKRLGFSLQEIGELFSLYDEHKSHDQLITMIDIIEQKQQQLIHQRKDIDVTLNELERAKKRCQRALIKADIHK
ncbi:MerR family transcriptional regulator [Photobacterium leiognathi]|uniref:MerR family transcriptional regulator n=1 Tax=Photobacterium leiognathi subsp. mandapamensis TaxID=48408 RepID=A0A2T3KS51_PHOLD|nr:MerR family DNA-binding transcriptional regulator [Photobacterium leiognathi]PSV09184.1 MerR family transcriptional regulator [Photobacterium leiognathi subsp. mandapamensis]